MTNRWQTFTEVKLGQEVLEKLAGECDEFLIHGVDVEGQSSGVEEELVCLLADWNGTKMTYAGGIGSMEELEHFRRISGENWILRLGVHWTCSAGRFLIGKSVGFMKKYERSI